MSRREFGSINRDPGYAATARLLLEAGSDTTLINKQGKTVDSLLQERVNTYSYLPEDKPILDELCELVQQCRTQRAVPK